MSKTQIALIFALALMENRMSKIQREVEEFIAAHELSNHHFLRDEDIVEHFHQYDPKLVMEAIKNLR